MSCEEQHSMEWQKISQRTYYRGRVALYAILQALGVGRNDEVACQAFTCVAVPEAILACGAKPVFIDIEPDGLNLDPIELKQKISSRTRAIVVQHTFGIPASMTRIMAITEQAGLPVIEDCCHTFLSTLENQYVGSFGAASFYSFEWGKPLALGIGGSAIANDPELARRLTDSFDELRYPGRLSQVKLELQGLAHRILYRPELYWKLKTLFHGLSKFGVAEGNYNPVGGDSPTAGDFSMKMAPRLERCLKNELQQIAKQADHSRRLVSQLEALIPQDSCVRPRSPSRVESVYSRYPMRVKEKGRLLVKAREENLELAEWYSTPIHPLSRDQSGCVFYEPDSCPNAEERSQEIVSLPLHSRVGRSYVEKISEFLRKAA